MSDWKIKWRQENAGFSLLEVIIAMGIFVLLIGSITAIFSTAFRSKDIVFEQLANQGAARKAAQDFVNELRSAAYSSIGGFPLAVASSTEIIFYSNIDKDSLVERVHYWLSGTTFKKGVIKPSGTPLGYPVNTEASSTAASYVNNGGNPVFYYYDETYTGASSTPLSFPVDLTKVRLVGISINIDKDPAKSPAAFAIQAQAEMRNLKSN